MYSLKQVEILAFQQLAERLEKAGYTHILGCTGIWEHETRQTVFCLCVDDFRVKHFNRDDVDHLLKTLGNDYKYTVD